MAVVRPVDGQAAERPVSHLLLALGIGDMSDDPQVSFWAPIRVGTRLSSLRGYALKAWVFPCLVQFLHRRDRRCLPQTVRRRVGSSFENNVSRSSVRLHPFSCVFPF